MRRLSLLFCLLLLAMHLPVQAEAPNIVFITVDTTRADRMGFLGNTHGLTPNLDLVARQGVVFERAYSQAPLTPVSHATIFTGTYPQFHTVTDFGHPLPTLLPYLPEILQKSGYHTAAFIGSLILDPHASMARCRLPSQGSSRRGPIRHGRTPWRRGCLSRYHLAHQESSVAVLPLGSPLRSTRAL